MNKKIDNLLNDMMNAETEPSEALVNNMKQKFKQISLDTDAKVDKVHASKRIRMWMPIAGTAAIFVLLTILYINNPLLYQPQIANPPKSQEQVLPSTQNKNKLPYNSNFNSNNVKSSPNNNLVNPDKKFSAHEKAPKAISIIPSIETLNTKQSFRPGEVLQYSVTFKAPGEEGTEFADNPLVQIFKCGETTGDAISETPIEDFSGTILKSMGSRSVNVEIHVPSEPGWYTIDIKTQIKDNNGQIGTYTAYGSRFFVEYPENGTYVGELVVNKKIDVNGYNVAIDKISMNTKESYVNISVDSRLTECDLAILTDDGQKISLLDNSVPDSSSTPGRSFKKQRTYLYAPIPKDTQGLIFEVRRVGVLLAGTSEQGESKDMEGSWKVEIKIEDQNFGGSK